MKISSTPNQPSQAVPSVYTDATCQHRDQLKQTIKDFLSAASTTPSGRLNCTRCGRPMQYIDTVFWLYGEERSFPIRLPRCPCTAELSEPAAPDRDIAREN